MVHNLKYSSSSFFLRRKEWWINIRRADITEDDLKSKKVCSVHFEPSQYNCPTDIGNSSLTGFAKPTLIECPNPPPLHTPQRKKPRDRSLTTGRPPKRPRQAMAPSPKPHHDEASDTLEDQEGGMEEALSEVEILRVEVKELKERVEMLLAEDAKKTLQMQELQKALDQTRNTNRVKNQKVSRMTKREKKKNEEMISSLKKVDEARKMTVDELLANLPVLPRAVMEVMLKGGKWVNWSQHEETLELCLSLLFRSPSAYEQLRAAGFLLPHPRTLRKRFSSVLKKTGFCPRLLEMVAMRCKDFTGHEKLVTLSLDGMRLTTGLSYDKHSDSLTGFEDLGNHGRSRKVANEGVVVMVRGLTKNWKQIIGYFVTGKAAFSINSLINIYSNFLP